MEKNVEEVLPHQARKRKSDPERNKRLQAKAKRYSSTNLPERYPCRHNSEAYKCVNLCMPDILEFNKAFYARANKEYQDNYIINYCFVKNPSRVRIVNGKGHNKSMSIIYNIKKRDGTVIPVCRNMFLKSLCIKKGRVIGVLKRHKDSGMMAIEKRGGDRKSNKLADMVESIKSFIKKFKGVEAHYCRSKTRRIYLSSELSIAALHKLFLQENPNFSNCKESFFRKIFTTKFNIGFSHPRSDMCSKCLELKEGIKREKDGTKNNNLKTELNIHVKRSQAFFDLLQDTNTEIKILSFDCGKNQPLPKLPDQMSYYTRQLYIHHFTIVEGHSHSKLTQNNVYSYVWTEDSFAKGSNELASALYHCLLNNINFNGIKTLRLMADGCSGQNKNSIILGMISKWLSSNAPELVKKVEIIFPVTGHSFIPPDRIFGIIEKSIKKRNVIVDPGEYIDLIKEHCTVFKLNDIPVSDWKTAVQDVQKSTQALHFKITQCKRFILTRKKKDKREIIVRGEPYYYNDISLRRTITKPGKVASDILPIPLTTAVKVKRAKLTDVESLLHKHYGNEWKTLEQLQYYKNVIETNTNIDIESEITDNNDLCEEYIEEPHVSDLI